MTNDNQHIPSGYKPSPLGIIPEDWEVKRLGEITTKIGSGITPRGGQNVYVTNGHPFMRSQNVSNGHLLLDDIVYIDDSTHQKQISTEIKPYDVLLNITGASIGRCAVAEESIVGGNVNQHVCIIRLKNKNLSYYVCSFLLSYLGQKQVDSFQAGGNREGLNYEQISSFKICVPPSNEIDQITNILSLWDTAIAKQAALIEKLTLRKSGLMQQLLTGKKRLKGFEGEWKEVRMQDLASFAGGGTPSTKRSDFWEGTIPWISSSDLVEDCLTNNESRYITEEAIANSTTQLLPSKSILIVTRVGVGKVAIAKHPICVSQDFTCLTKYDADTLFLAYSLLLTMKKKKSQSQGTSIKGISTDEISKIKLLLPSIEEQKAIASVLVNAVKEIEIQKQKLAALQEQKKGLMQVLLTGKRRIKT